MSKSIQLGFRCTPDVAERLKGLAFERNTSVQAILDAALNQWLEAEQESPIQPVGGLSAYEEKYVEEFLEALRHGDADLVDSIRQMVRSTVRLARKHSKPARKRAAS